jgi:hypothetical protein
LDKSRKNPPFWEIVDPPKTSKIEMRGKKCFKIGQNEEKGVKNASKSTKNWFSTEKPVCTSL